MLRQFFDILFRWRSFWSEWDLAERESARICVQRYFDEVLKPQPRSSRLIHRGNGNAMQFDQLAEHFPFTKGMSELVADDFDQLKGKVERFRTDAQLMLEWSNLMKVISKLPMQQKPTGPLLELANHLIRTDLEYQRQSNKQNWESRSRDENVRNQVFQALGLKSSTVESAIEELVNEKESERQLELKLNNDVLELSIVD